MCECIFVYLYPRWLTSVLPSKCFKSHKKCDNCIEAAARDLKKTKQVRCFICRTRYTLTIFPPNMGVTLQWLHALQEQMCSVSSDVELLSVEICCEQLRMSTGWIIPRVNWIPMFGREQYLPWRAGWAATELEKCWLIVDTHDTHDTHTQFHQKSLTCSCQCGLISLFFQLCFLFLYRCVSYITAGFAKKPTTITFSSSLSISHHNSDTNGKVNKIYWDQFPLCSGYVEPKSQEYLKWI